MGQHRPFTQWDARWALKIITISLMGSRYTNICKLTKAQCTMWNSTKSLKNTSFVSSPSLAISPSLTSKTNNCRKCIIILRFCTWGTRSTFWPAAKQRNYHTVCIFQWSQFRGFLLLWSIFTAETRRLQYSFMSISTSLSWWRKLYCHISLFLCLNNRWPKKTSIWDWLSVSSTSEITFLCNLGHVIRTENMKNV